MMVGTISIWFKGDSSGSYGSPLISFDNSSLRSKGYLPVGVWASALPETSISYFNGDYLQAGYQNGRSFYFDDRWHHVVVVVGENYNKIYLDGVSLALDYQYGTPNRGNVFMHPDIARVILGNRLSSDFGTFSFTGAIDEIRIYNRPLSEAEIQELYTNNASVISEFIDYDPVADPVIQSNPADCKPFAVGDLSSGKLSLQVGLPAFASGVDVYLAIGFADALFLIDGSNGMHPTSELTVLPPWKTNNSTAIDESLYGDIPTILFRAGVYNLYTLVVPTGETDFSHYYFWATSFNLNH